MKDDLAINVERISKVYRLGVIGTGTLSHDLNRLWAKIRGKDDPYSKVSVTNEKTSKSESDYIKALSNISFNIKKGEVVGIIGKNGAGKSTLLKILSRITNPTSGSIKINGRVASLLEVGTGFHPELTGRENIYLNGAILGMSKSEIDSKINDIIEFSGILSYVDTPVKRYSSGMKVRLGFSVAAHLDPEILIIDEVLAVGDFEFQKKCIEKVREISQKGDRTVLFVSHNLSSVSSLCSRSILLENGEQILDDKTDKVIQTYMNSKTNKKIVFNENDSNAFVEEISFSSQNLEFDVSEDVCINFHLNFKKSLESVYFIFRLEDSVGNVIFVQTDEDYCESSLLNKKGRFIYNVVIPKFILKPNKYFITFSIYNSKEKKVEHMREASASFVVNDISTRKAQLKLYKERAIISPKLKWNIKWIILSLKL